MIAALTLAFLSAVPNTADVALHDARLNDVCFVDHQHGWAVGDRGVIWHSADGGRQWRLQTSGVDCSLSAVHFHDDQLGWAAGGFVHPFTHTSTGVLLATRDGGKTWTRSPRLLLPAIRRLRFFDPQHGWTIACSSAMFPSGVFATDDGGRHWRPVPGGIAADWLGGDFLNPNSGALAGRNGTLATIRRGEIAAARAEQLVLPSFVELRLSTPMHGWLVGDGGLVRTTVDLGATWQASTGPMPTAALLFDFAALAVRGPKCWIAGTPGTLVFHTDDGGRRWNSFATGATVPLRAVQFIDDQLGWAVGELGTILSTSDGGRTWQTQQAGGSHAALLGLFADPEDVPLELIGRLAGNEGYLTAVDVIGRRDVEISTRDYVHVSHRLHEAVSLSGGSAADVAWRFPLRQAGLAMDAQHIAAAWDVVNGGRGREELQAYLVRQIRVWRPEVVVTSDLPGTQDRSLKRPALLEIIHQAVLRAIAEAADPNAFPAQIAEAGLTPWHVKKVYGIMPPGARGGTDLLTSQFAPRLGRSLADAAAEPRGLLFDHFTLSPATIGFRLLRSAVGQEADRRDFFSGITLRPGGPARRQLPPAGERLDRQEHIAQRRRIVQAIVDRAAQSLATPEQLLARIDDMTRDLDDDSRARMLYQLADRYHRTGRWPLAAELFQVLALRYPEHALAPPAGLWLLQYYASREAVWRVERDEGPKRWERAVTLAKEIERTRPEWFAEPAVCFPLAAAYRGLNEPRQAEGIYQLQSHGSDRGAWRTSAENELYLSDPRRRAAKPMLPCVKAETKPLLDGMLDDAVWQKAKSAALQSAQHDDADWPAAVMLAYDAEYLYLAAHCRRVAAEKGDSPTSPRLPDTDLSARDRIEILLDVDRDLTTYYRLVIDQYGWTNDSLWGDSTWNPQWFVAAKQDKAAWSIEAAIPLAEFAGQPPQPKEVWMLGIQRIVPGVGFQSWTTPAAISVLPDGFGCLQFQP